MPGGWGVQGGGGRRGVRRSAPELLVYRRCLRAGRRVRSVAERRRIRCPASSSVAIPGGGNIGGLHRSWFYQGTQWPISRRKESPALLRMSGLRLRCVRSLPYLGEVRVYTEPSLSLNRKMRGEGRTAYGTERIWRSASERMCAECAEPIGGAKWRSRGD